MCLCSTCHPSTSAHSSCCKAHLRSGARTCASLFCRKPGLQLTSPQPSPCSRWRSVEQMHRQVRSIHGFAAVLQQLLKHTGRGGREISHKQIFVNKLTPPFPPHHTTPRTGFRTKPMADNIAMPSLSNANYGEEGGAHNCVARQSWVGKQAGVKTTPNQIETHRHPLTIWPSWRVVPEELISISMGRVWPCFSRYNSSATMSSVTAGTSCVGVRGVQQMRVSPRAPSKRCSV